MIRALLLDIEGTTSSLEFVRDVLFPYAQRHLSGFIEQHRGAPEVEAELVEVARHGRLEGLGEDLPATLLRWMAEDRKLTPLKALQGLLWEDAFARGVLVAHVYPDVPPALAAFSRQGLRLGVYSSGSVRAQQAFFRHSASGDLTKYIDAWFDTRVGSKSEPASYVAIASALGLPPASIAFLSDSPVELDAARAAGLETIGVLRGPLRLGQHAAATSFTALPLGDSAHPVAERAGPANAKAEVVELSRHCHGRGWASATSGNFSVRADAGRVAITASGVDKGRLTERDVLWLGLDARALEPGTPSAEAPLHAALYRSSPKVGAVIHTHSVAATLLSRRRSGGSELRLSGYEMAKAIAPAAGGVPPDLVLPIFANSQDTAALAERVGEHLAAAPAPAYLIEGHGLTTWGVDAERARHRTEALEFMLACELEASRAPGGR